MTNSFIPISAVKLGPDVEESVLQVIRSGIVAQGPMVARLEREFAEMIGVEHVVAVNNGTTALIAAVMASGLGPGDEVVTSPFTFVATLNAIIASGATARFADISSADFNIDPTMIPSAVTERTRAVMPVHLYGQCADMPEIAEIARIHGFGIIEDAAQAHGARIGSRAAGSWGVGCFSLYATKNITSAEGGLISTNDDSVADYLRVLRNQGMRERYVYEMAGNNFRLTDLQAAICVPQLSTYDQLVETRQNNANRLSKGLASVPGITPPHALVGRHHVWHQYTIMVDDDARLSRDELIAGLAAAGIGSGIYYPKLVFDYDCYRGHPQVHIGEFPVAERVVRDCLSLPVHPLLSESDLDRIISTISSLMAA